VQCALHERPMVVVYRLSPLSYRLGKRFVKVDMYAMPNLVAGSRIVPELIQDDFTPERVEDEVVSLLTDRERHARMTEALRRVKAQLGTPGASSRAADAVLEVISASAKATADEGGVQSA
jgi:lipid-A-disaccharide synthase